METLEDKALYNSSESTEGFLEPETWYRHLLDGIASTTILTHIQ
jgi:hypothetical protein